MGGEFIRVNLLSLFLSTGAAIVAIMLAFLAFRVIDIWLLKSIDFLEEIKKNNIAAAIVYAAVLFAVAIVVGSVLR